MQSSPIFCRGCGKPFRESSERTGCPRCGQPFHATAEVVDRRATFQVVFRRLTAGGSHLVGRLGAASSFLLRAPQALWARIPSGDLPTDVVALSLATRSGPTNETVSTHPRSEGDGRVACTNCAELILPKAKACRFCGHTLSQGTFLGMRPGFMLGCLGCISLTLLVIIPAFLAEVPRLQQQRLAEEDPQRFVAEELIQEWQRGNRGERFWKAGLEPTALYAVTKSEFLAGGTWENVPLGLSWRRFRIQSSTAAGISIEKTWNVCLADGSAGWRVFSVHDSAQGGITEYELFIATRKPGERCDLDAFSEHRRASDVGAVAGQARPSPPHALDAPRPPRASDAPNPPRALDGANPSHPLGAPDQTRQFPSSQRETGGPGSWLETAEPDQATVDRKIDEIARKRTSADMKKSEEHGMRVSEETAKQLFQIQRRTVVAETTAELAVMRAARAHWNERRAGYSNRAEMRALYEQVVNRMLPDATKFAAMGVFDTPRFCGVLVEEIESEVRRRAIERTLDDPK